MTIRCPDCNGRMIDAGTDRAFCGFKNTPGYGPCGVARQRPTLAEAAAAVLAAGWGDYDQRNVCISLYEVGGRRRREWDDLRAALEAMDLA